MGGPMHGMGDAAMTERKPSTRQAVFGSPSARASGNPFNEMREEIAALRKDKLRRATLDHIVNCLRGAERDYAEGNMYDAVLGVWKAAWLEVVFTELNAPKILREKRGTPPAGRKAKANAAWTRAFNTHKHFRHWDARDQAEHLSEKHSASVAGIIPETLVRYMRVFRKQMQ